MSKAPAGRQTGVSAALSQASGQDARRDARGSTRDDQIDRLGALALLVGLDLERDALALVERLEPGPLDSSDVHEHIAPAIVRLDEAVAALGVEELDRAGHGHRETPLPVVARRRPPRRDGLGRTFTIGESITAA